MSIYIYIYAYVLLYGLIRFFRNPCPRCTVSHMERFNQRTHASKPPQNNIFLLGLLVLFIFYSCCIVSLMILSTLTHRLSVVAYNTSYLDLSLGPNGHPLTLRTSERSRTNSFCLLRWLMGHRGFSGPRQKCVCNATLVELQSDARNCAKFWQHQFLGQ